MKIAYRERLSALRKCGAPGRILVVDNDDGSRHGLEKLLGSYGLEVASARTRAEARARAAGLSLALLVTHIELADGRGDDLAEELRRWFPELHVIYTSCAEAPLLRVPGVVVEKPLDPNAFVALANRVLEGATAPA